MQCAMRCAVVWRGVLLCDVAWGVMCGGMMSVVWCGCGVCGMQPVSCDVNGGACVVVWRRWRVVVCAMPCVVVVW